MKVLITGINGFVGSHLAEHYLDIGEGVYGFIRHRGSRDFIKDIEESITLLEGDLTDSHSVYNAIHKVKPDVIHHLGAQSFVPASWLRPAETLQTNVLGSLNILEVSRNEIPNSVIHVASTSEVYGPQTEIPIKETNELNPASPYAVSKLSMEYLASQYYKSYGLKTIITRAFNHAGPRRGEYFVESKIARKVCEARRYGASVLKLGNIENKRDWTDVRDIVQAYRIAVDLCEPGTPYNISSGITRSIKSLIDEMSELYGINGNLTVEIEDSFKRPSDIPVLLGDSTRFRERTGWKPLIDWQDTCVDLLDYWNNK